MLYAIEKVDGQYMVLEIPVELEAATTESFCSKWQAEDASRHLDMFSTKATVGLDCVVRWNSNNRVPPQDIIERWNKWGLISDLELELSKMARKADEAKAIEEYVFHRKENGYTAEEKFEMQAAFGPDADIVDVFTGKKVK